jgi:hypothetical protein
MEDIINIDKPKAGERYKNLKYKDERKDLTKKLLQLLKIDAGNKVFTSYDLDKDEETQKKILEMIPDIEKYYSVSKWNYWRENKKDKKYISLTKSVLKDMDIIILATNKKIKQDIKLINYIQYTITSDIDVYL